MPSKYTLEHPMLFDSCIKGIPRIDPYDYDIYQRKCCCVVALMKATGWTYKFSLDFCRDYGRKDNGPMYTADVVRMFEGPTLKSASVRGPYSKSKRITITKFIEKHPEGRFFCLHRGHAFAIVDGVLYDHTDAHRRQIYYAVRVYPEKFCH